MTYSYQRYCISTATENGTNVVLTLNGTPNLTNGAKIVLRFKEGTPYVASALPVVVSIGGTDYPLLNRFGNPMTGSDLKPSTMTNTYCPRVNYLTYYGSSTPHLIAHNYPFANCSYYAC